MYILAHNQIVEKFPYSIDDLRKDNPRVSFSNSNSTEMLASYNVFPVVRTDATYDTTTQVAEPNGCVYTGTRWETAWTVRDKKPEEAEQYIAALAYRTRLQRDELLQDTDWTMLADAPVDQTAWATYRQALRDVSAQAGFPNDVVWPIKPLEVTP